jgi:redox-sensing transcriptional repressor
MQQKISDSAVRRLSLYLRCLRDSSVQGVDVVSSGELARGSGTTPAQVRKDLSLFGSFGKRGSGYQVAVLTERLESILGLEQCWPVALVGVGRIGTALLGHGAIAERGFDIVAAFDVARRKVGRRIQGIEVSPVDELVPLVRKRSVKIGIIATPPGAAQKVAERLTEAGVRAILNFAPVKLVLAEGVTTRSVDVGLELEGLSYHLVAELHDKRGNAEVTDT